jgi:LmbE family N-acetylglucosaminyl deacetylase
MMIRKTMVIALAALAFAPAGAQEQAAPQTAFVPRVLVVLAHPDDELLMAPALAALGRQGTFVTLVYATQGDVGPGVSGMEPGENLGKVRLQEAECAGDALGVAYIAHFNRGDGRLGIDVHREGSAAAALKADLSTHIAGQTLILTWGPDGGYGHGDHRMVSAMTTQIVQAMPAEVRPRLLYVGIPAGSLPPVPEMAQWATTDPGLLTETVPYTPADLEAAKAAAQCHVTQFDAATRAGMMGLFDATMWRGKVHFRPAF